MSHTPTPWAIFNDHPDLDTANCLAYIRPSDADRETRNPWGFSDIACCYGFDEPEQKSNVEFIVRAVNAHEELVAALRSFIVAFEQNDGDFSDIENSRYIAARSAVAKAEAE